MPLVWYEGSGTTDKRWLLADERGSVVAVTNASGAATTINTYDEHGIPASGNVGRFGYTGQASLPELGLSYYKARMYSPTLGRFLQTDPIGYADGPNWYNYVGSDPVNGIDPSGLTACPAGKHDDDRPAPIRRADDGSGDIVLEGRRHCVADIELDFGAFGFGYGGSDFPGAFGLLGGIPEGEPQKESKPCPVGKILTLGLSGDLAILFGGSAGGGVAINLSSGKLALYGSAGNTYGIAIDEGISLGLYNSFSDFKNSTTTVGGGILAGSGDVSLSASGKIVGGAGQIGFGLPVSARATKSNTVLVVVKC